MTTCGCWCHKTYGHALRCDRWRPCHGESVYAVEKTTDVYATSLPTHPLQYRLPSTTGQLGQAVIRGDI